jgi:4-amino-4-deoxy-L-arabinose transferase-like glycosyltransferase
VAVAMLGLQPPEYIIRIMTKRLNKSSKRRGALVKEFRKHKLIYFLLGTILLGALFLRVYRTGTILWFFYDQGRDALVIWDFLKNGNLFLIGPTTGIAGIFRGPFYYYLISPFYFLGGGNPVWPANFLATTSVVAIALLYYLTSKIHSKTSGIAAVFIASFSFYLVYDSRWLSNPTPMLILSMLLVFFIFMVIDGRKWAWAGISFVAGLSLFHFGSSGELFYFPAIFLLALWKRKTLSLKVMITSALLFLATASPLILFDFKNEHLLFNNIKGFLSKGDSFKSSFSTIFSERIEFYRMTFFSRIFPNVTGSANLYLAVFALVFLVKLPPLLKREKFKALLLVFLSPLVGLLFFQGNEGNVFGYYLTGYFLIFIVLFGITMAEIWKNILGKLFICIFLISFLSSNLPLTFSRLMDNVDGPSTIALGNQKQAIEWAYADAKGQNFNTDFYVPPAVPHAYEYLFTWYESRPGYDGRVEELKPLLYTLYEVDNEVPGRLTSWLSRQAGIGRVEDEVKFGGVTAQRRQRLN